MLVKEEKILLMAKVDGSNGSIYNAIRQIVEACVIPESLHLPLVPRTFVDKFTLFDLEYVFLKIRAQSVSNVQKVVYRDAEDKKDYPFEVNLDELKIKWPDKSEHTIALGTNGFTMKYPSASLYASPLFSNPNAKEEELVEELIIACIDSYFDGDKVYKFADNKKDDIKGFINSLEVSAYNKLKDWVANLPRLHYELTYTNSLGNERKIEMSTLSDFFTF